MAAPRVLIAGCRLDGASSAALDVLSRVLDGKERRRMAALPDEEARRRYLVSHALLRATLSRAGGGELAAWRFGRRRSGRPVLSSPSRVPLHFSLSRTASFVLCAVSSIRRIGIDAERIDGRRSLDEIMAYALTPGEREWCRGVDAAERLHRFYDLWTLKEAYLKAGGTGLRRPPRRVGFALGAGGAPRLGGVPGARSARRWTFRLFAPAPDLRCALALGIPEGRSFEEIRAKMDVEELIAAVRGGRSPSPV